MSTQQQQQLDQLPTDITDKIVGMLAVKSRPYAVLMALGERRSKIKKDSITPEETMFLYEGRQDRDGQYIFSNQYNNNTKELGYNALALEFRFLNEEARTRWQRGEPFEMYRDAVVPKFV